MRLHKAPVDKMSFGLRTTILEEVNTEAKRTRDDLVNLNKRLTTGLTDIIHRVDYPKERMRIAADQIYDAADLEEEEEKPSVSPYEHESGGDIKPYKLDTSNNEISIDIEGLNDIELYERVGQAMKDYFEEVGEEDIETDLSEIGNSLVRDYW